jgi:hypothetical protein
VIQINKEKSLVWLDTNTDVYSACEIITKELERLGYTEPNEKPIRPPTAINSSLGEHLLRKFLDDIPLPAGEYLTLTRWAEELMVIMHGVPDADLMHLLEILPQHYSYGLQFTKDGAAGSVKSDAFMRKLYQDVVNANKGAPNYAAMLFLGAILVHVSASNDFAMPTGVRMLDELQRNGYDRKYGSNTFKIYFDDHKPCTIIIAGDVSDALCILANNLDDNDYYYRHTGRIGANPILLGKKPFQDCEWSGHLAKEFAL